MSATRPLLSFSLAVVAWTLALLAPMPVAAQSGSALPAASAGEAVQQAEAGPTITRIASAAANVAPGAAEGWRVVVVSGTVRHLTIWADGSVRWGAVAAGQVFPAETQLETAADGHLVLFNGHDSLTLSPGSRVIVPAEASPAEHIRILQDLGTVRYDVESRNPGPSGIGAFLTRVRRALTTDGPPAAALFEVRTPHAVVVVKGTSFTITVTPLETRIVVLEGVVGVRDLASGEVLDLLAGQSVVVGLLQEAGLMVQPITSDLLEELETVSAAAGQIGGTAGTALETLDEAVGALGGSEIGGLIGDPGATVSGISGLLGGGGGGSSGGSSSGGSSSGGSSSSSGSSGGGSSGSSSSGGGSSGGGGSVSDTVDSVSDSLGL